MKKLSDTYAELKKSVAYKKRVSVREMVLMVETILVKIKMTKKLDGINIIMQLRAQNQRNNSKAASTTVLHRVSFKMLQKILRPGRA